MQRRSFLRNAVCVGACASLFAPIKDVLASEDGSTGKIGLKFEQLEIGDASSSAASLKVRVSPRQLAAADEPLRVRAWFATDSGVQAFDLASFGRGGASQGLRFHADTRRLLGFELVHGRALDDCLVAAGCTVQGAFSSGLGAGRYQLSVHRDGHDLAAVDLDVSSVAA